MAAIIKMRKFRGDTLIFPIAITNKKDGTPVNLSGVAIKFTLNIVPPVDHNTPGITIDRTDDQGKFTITIPHEAVTAAVKGLYPMDVEILYPNNRKSTLFVVELTLVGEQTP